MSKKDVSAKDFVDTARIEFKNSDIQIRAIVEVLNARLQTKFPVVTSQKAFNELEPDVRKQMLTALRKLNKPSPPVSKVIPTNAGAGLESVMEGTPAAEVPIATEESVSEQAPTTPMQPIQSKIGASGPKSPFVKSKSRLTAEQSADVASKLEELSVEFNRSPREIMKLIEFHPQLAQQQAAFEENDIGVPYFIANLKIDLLRFLVQTAVNASSSMGGFGSPIQQPIFEGDEEDDEEYAGSEEVASEEQGQEETKSEEDEPVETSTAPQSLTSAQTFPTDSDARENALPNSNMAVGNEVPGGSAQTANMLNAKKLAKPRKATEISVGNQKMIVVGADEEEDASIATANAAGGRQSELSEAAAASLEYQPNFTEVMDNAYAKLNTDESRGNLGAGTAAEMQSADLWGYQFSQAPKDIPVAPEKFLNVSPQGQVSETKEEEDSDVYSFLPFAKLSGVILWIPRHVEAARFFFTSDDYDELVSHVRDGDPLKLDGEEDADTLVMMSTIIRTYGQLVKFAKLAPLLPARASAQQIYAEWLEIKQIGKAIAKYQQISGGMYQNSDLSMKGGIRSAVAAALKPLVETLSKAFPGLISEEDSVAKPLSGSMFGDKRKAEQGVVLPEEYNPQFSFAAPSFKRTKFSIPTI